MASPILKTLLDHSNGLKSRKVEVDAGEQTVTLYRKPLSFVDALTVARVRDLDPEEYEVTISAVFVRLYTDKDGSPVFEGTEDVQALDADTFTELLQGLGDGGADAELIEGKSS